MAGFDRSRINLTRRAQQQTDTRDDMSSGSRQGYMNYGSTGLKFFKYGEPGTYHDLNILPWRIGSKNHPEVYRTKDEPETLKNGKPNPNKVCVGDFDYVLDIMVHKNIGPGNGDYICPKKNFGKPCPICDRADELWKDEATKKEARNLFAKRRCVYLVQELNDQLVPKTSEDATTPKIMEVSHSVFTQGLQGKATSCLRGKGVVNFADLEEGKVVSFNIEEGTMGNGKTFKKAANFEFNDRVEDISDEILEKCPSLDSLMIIKTADQLRAALYGDPDDVENDFDEQPDEEAAEERAPARFRENAPARFDDDPPTRATSEATPRRRQTEEVVDETPAPRRRQAADSEEATPRRLLANKVDEAPARRRQAEAPAETPRRRQAEAEDAYNEARRTARRTAVDDTPADTNRVERTEATSTMPFDDEPDETATASRGDEANTCPFGCKWGVDADSKGVCAKCPQETWEACCAAHKKNS